MKNLELEFGISLSVDSFCFVDRSLGFSFRRDPLNNANLHKA
jgi:hypothetical protein